MGFQLPLLTRLKVHRQLRRRVDGSGGGHSP